MCYCVGRLVCILFQLGSVDSNLAPPPNPLVTVVYLIFRLQDDSPARWKGRVMNVQSLILEVVATEHGRDAEGGSIGQIDLLDNHVPGCC